MRPSAASIASIAASMAVASVLSASMSGMAGLLRIPPVPAQEPCDRLDRRHACRALGGRSPGAKHRYEDAGLGRKKLCGNGVVEGGSSSPCAVRAGIRAMPPTIRSPSRQRSQDAGGDAGRVSTTEVAGTVQAPPQQV